MLVARGRELVLSLPRDPPLGRGQGHVLPHREAGAGLDVLRDRWDELRGTDARERLESLRRAPGPVGREQPSAQPLADRDGRVARAVDPACDGGADLSEGDLVRHEDRRLEARAAGLLDVIGRRRRVQPRAEHGLAGEVEVRAVLEDGPGHDLSDALSCEAEAGDEPVERRRQHVLVRGHGVRTVGPGEGDAIPPEHRDPPGLTGREAGGGRGSHGISWCGGRSCTT